MPSIWSGVLGARGEVALTARNRRVTTTMAPSVRSATKRMRTMYESGQRPSRLLFRDEYACLREPGDSAASDRHALKKAQRPPVTRLASPRGSSLRLHLTALAVAQFAVRPGQRFANPYPLQPPSASATGWTDLLASTASDTTNGTETRLTASDKRRRALALSLDNLADARLVRLPYRHRGARKHEGFELLDESATRGPDDDPIPYTVPAPGPHTFGLPVGFALNGWLHLLEDSEIAVLLMIACGKLSLDAEWTAVPADERNRHYGITRETFQAHHALSAFGLIEVEGLGRHPDGKSVDFPEEGSMLHRMRVHEAGFANEALKTIKEAIQTRRAS